MHRMGILFRQTRILWMDPSIGQNRMYSPGSHGAMDPVPGHPKPLF